MHSRTALAAALALCTAAVSAQTLKPGLWEMSTRMSSSSGQMEQAMAQAQAQMANMPPAQRKMIEDMMAKQGVGMTAGGANTVRICLTPEMVAKDSLPAQTQGDCRSTSSPRVGNTMKISFTCTNPPSSGDGTVTFLGPESYATKMTVNTQVQGRPERIGMDSTGRFVAGDCGAIRPIGSGAAPAKK